MRRNDRRAVVEAKRVALVPSVEPGLDWGEDDDGYADGAYLGDAVTCWRCGGEGIDVTCMDDICHGLGYCMHGDGQRACRECGGEGWL